MGERGRGRGTKKDGPVHATRAPERNPDLLHLKPWGNAQHADLLKAQQADLLKADPRAGFPAPGESYLTEMLNDDSGPTWKAPSSDIPLPGNFPEPLRPPENACTGDFPKGVPETLEKPKDGGLGSAALNGVAEFSGLQNIPLAGVGWALNQLGLGDELNNVVGGVLGLAAHLPLEEAGQALASQPGPALLSQITGAEEVASGLDLGAQLVDEVFMMKGLGMGAKALGSGAKALGTGLDLQVKPPGSLWPTIDNPPGMVTRHSGPGGLSDSDPLYGLMEPEPVHLQGIRNQHVGERLSTKTPTKGRSVGQQQGRENRVDWLETYEYDDKQPAHVRGWLKNERRRVEHGNGSSVPRNPPGYELAHGRETPAREGFDYGSTALQGEDLNGIEEMVRRRAGRP